MSTLSVDDIIQTVKDEASRREAASRGENLHVAPNALEARPWYPLAKKAGKFLQRHGLHSVVAVVRRRIGGGGVRYSLDDFLHLSDEAFIDNAFRKLLGRAPDHGGKTHYLSLLRSGKRSKVEILASLYGSREARAQNVVVSGMKLRFLQAKLYRLPLLGYLLKWFGALAALPRLLERMNAHENLTASQMGGLEQRLVSFENALHAKADTAALQNVINELGTKSSLSQLQQLHNQVSKTVQTFAKQLQAALEQKASAADLESLQNSLLEKQGRALESLRSALHVTLESKATKREFDIYMQTLGYAKISMNLVQQSLQELINEAKKRLPEATLNTQEPKTLTHDIQFDDFYVAFEERFRGNRESVKMTLGMYLPYLEAFESEKKNFAAVDIGCGRGEWLELLKDEGYENVKGVDGNAIMVEQCKELGLNALQSDALTFLSEQEHETLHLVSAFHLIEHLPFEIARILLGSAFRCLHSGGMIILETPNLRNILVGACDFYLDPTHKTPIHPATLKFLLEEAGFVGIDTLIRNDNQLIDYKTLSFDSMNDYVDIGRDLCVIGYKR